MALQLRYIVRQFEIDCVPSDGIHVRGLIDKEVYDDASGEVVLSDRLAPDVDWANIPTSLKQTLGTLKTQMLSLLKAKLGTDEVYIFAP